MKLLRRILDAIDRLFPLPPPLDGDCSSWPHR